MSQNGKPYMCKIFKPVPSKNIVSVFRLDRTAATKVAIHFTKRKLNSTEIKIQLKQKNYQNNKNVKNSKFRKHSLFKMERYSLYESYTI